MNLELFSKEFQSIILQLMRNNSLCLSLDLIILHSLLSAAESTAFSPHRTHPTLVLTE